MGDMEWLSIEGILQTMRGHWLLLTLIIILVYIYHHYTRTFSYFKEKGVEYIKPTIIFGNFFDVLTRRIGNHEFYKNAYEHFEGLPYGGIFEGSIPKLLIRDPELIKTICIKDANYFPDRARNHRPAQPCNRRDLLFLRGNEWKQARSIISPSFTSGKLKAMEGLIQQCGTQMTDLLKKRPEGEWDMEMKIFTGRYTLQNIATCAFGLDSASLKDENSTLLKHTYGIFKGSTLSRFLFLTAFLFYPPLAKYAPLSKANTDATNYFSNIIDQVRAERRKDKDKRRPDFLQLLLNYEEKESQESPKDLFVDDLFIHGQSILFLLAGYETTSTLLSYACHLLAVHTEIQDKLRQDILKAYQEHGNNITYEMINGIPYLEQVILETLRLYPPVPRIERQCTTPYTLPNTNIKLQPGDIVTIPVYGIMSDPQYYPEPWKFNPERFNPSEKSTRANELFLTFGLGPRNCIGLRFSLMSAKFYLCYLLKEFKLVPCAKTQYPIAFDKSAILLSAEKGNWVRIEPVQKA